jgi:hypothetical protein
MKVKVENLGSIKKGEIEIKPLTIFVGKNGVNKSYMAHVVYGVAGTFFAGTFSGIAAKVSIKEFLKDNLSLFHKDIKDMEITNISSLEEKAEEFLLKFLDFLESRLRSVDVSRSMQEIFNPDAPHIFKNLRVSFSIGGLKKKLQNFRERIKIYSVRLVREIFLLREKKSLALNELLWEIESFLEIHLIFPILRELELEVYYFPSSRTGFVLAFDDIMAGVFRERFGGKATTRLTKPAIDFLSHFADIKAGRFGRWEMRKRVSKGDVETIQRVVTFINRRILRGEIVENERDGKYKEFYYQPLKKEVLLSPYLSSSGVIELLPLVEFIKNFKSLNRKFLIIEEPEAHLHPQAQVEMARFLAMLVNNGAHVLITTHSDYIVDEINNCIRLAGVKEEDKKKLLDKYGLSDYPDVAISHGKVGVYLFKEVDDKVEVKPLQVDKYGITDENFSEVGEELLERSIELGEKIE